MALETYDKISTPLHRSLGGGGCYFLGPLFLGYRTLLYLLNKLKSECLNLLPFNLLLLSLRMRLLRPDPLSPPHNLPTRRIRLGLRPQLPIVLPDLMDIRTLYLIPLMHTVVFLPGWWLLAFASGGLAVRRHQVDGWAHQLLVRGFGAGCHVLGLRRPLQEAVADYDRLFMLGKPTGLRSGP
jgi:hypothetical protein